jgi:hypothetical protein
MIPVIYLSYDEERAPLLFGDQMMINTIFKSHKEFKKFIGLNGEIHEGAIITMSLYHNEKYMDKLNKYISNLDWVLIIFTGNELNSDAYRELKHPNMKIWLQTPKENDEADRYLPFGYPSNIEYKEEKKKYDWFFAGQVTHKARIDCMNQLKKLPNGKLLETNGFNKGYPYEEYIKYMVESKIIPCPAGPATPDTYRVYEALEVGSLPIVDNDWYWKKVFGFNPFPFVENWKHFSKHYYYELSQFDEKIKLIKHWWKSYKKSLYYNLIDDVNELRSNL